MALALFGLKFQALYNIKAGIFGGKKGCEVLPSPLWGHVSVAAPGFCAYCDLFFLF